MSARNQRIVLLFGDLSPRVECKAFTLAGTHHPLWFLSAVLIHRVVTMSVVLLDVALTSVRAFKCDLIREGRIEDKHV